MWVRVLRREFPLVFAGAVVSLVMAAQAGAATFSNSAPIVINDRAAATPYPSQIVVSGLGTITDVNVTLTGFTHGWPDDIDVLLVSPGGQSVILMSDPGGSQDALDLTFTFDDEAAAPLPEGALASGSYRPSNDFEQTQGCVDPFLSTADTMPAPAPAGPYGATLAAFDGTSANGSWSLYVFDDCSGDSGSFSGGWSLDITAGAITVGPTTKAQCKKGGWRGFTNPSFKNQGQCVKFVNHNGGKSSKGKDGEQNQGKKKPGKKK